MAVSEPEDALASAAAQAKRLLQTVADRRPGDARRARAARR